MVPSLFILLIIGLLKYAVWLRENRLTATASAIGQISDNMSTSRVSCSKNPLQGNSIRRSLDVPTFTANRPGTSHDRNCVCGSCPCTFIDHFLQTCNPVTKLYDSTKYAIMEYYNGLIQLMTYIYEYCTRVLECRITCLRSAQLTRSDENSQASEQFIFRQVPAPAARADRHEEISSVRADRHEEPPVKTKKSSIVSFRQPEKHDDNTSKIEPMKIKEVLSEETLKPDHSSSRGTLCQKCKEKGQTCVQTCSKRDEPKTTTK